MSDVSARILASMSVSVSASWNASYNKQRCRSGEELLLDNGTARDDVRNDAQCLLSDVRLPQLPGQRQHQRTPRIAGRLSSGHRLQHVSCQEVRAPNRRPLASFQTSEKALGNR